MNSHHNLRLALVLLVLATVAAALMAGVAVLGMQLTRPQAFAALLLIALLVGGAVMLHFQLRDARWDAGLRLR